MLFKKNQVGTLVYGTNGIAPAPTYFNLDSATGEIRVVRDLKQDRTTVYTVIYNFILYI